MQIDLAIRTCEGFPSAWAAAETPIDLQALYSRCSGNIALAVALIDELHSSGPRQVSAMMRSAAAGNLFETAEGAHALKGAAAIIGAEALSTKAARVEAAGRDGQAQGLLELLRDLDEEMLKCVACVPTLRRQALEGR